MKTTQEPILLLEFESWDRYGKLYCTNTFEKFLEWKEQYNINLDAPTFKNSIDNCGIRK